MKATILLVDDEPLVLSALWRCLRNDRYDIITAMSGEDALRIMRSRPVHLVISDQGMSRIQGIEFLALIKKHCPDTVRILLTGNPNLELAIDAVNRGEAFRFLTKPWNDAELIQVVADAVARSCPEGPSGEQTTDASPRTGVLQQLEHDHPGITRISKDAEGNLTLPEISDAELESIKKQL